MLLTQYDSIVNEGFIASIFILEKIWTIMCLVFAELSKIYEKIVLSIIKHEIG